MASIYDANTNYQINGVDLRDNPGLVTREYLIDVYPSLIDNFQFAGLWLWGENSSSALGTNDTVHRSSPVQTIAGGTNWKQVSCGGTISGPSFTFTASIKTDGTLWLWGYGGSGRLGTNNVVDRSSPVQTIAGGTNWKQVSCGRDTVVAIKTDGTLWTWGVGSSGQLGNNTATSRSSPVQTVSGGTNWKQVSFARDTAAAIKTDGTLWLWGVNTSGNLGTNDTVVSKSSPVQTIAGGTNWKQVSAGAATAAIKTDGTLWTWGSNFQGALGQNDIADRSSPVQVGANTNWKQVSVGSHSAAIKTDGTLWTWGFNIFGQLGLSDTTARSSPTQVGTGTNWKQVSVSGGDTTYTAAIKTDGTLWLWGYNTNGQLGNNNTTNTVSPIQTISGGTNWKQVSSGAYHVAAIRDDSSDPFRSEPL